MKIKRMVVKIEIQNKCYFLLKGKLKTKINWTKWSKIIKRIKINIEIKNKNKFFTEWWIWKEKLI